MMENTRPIYLILLLLQTVYSVAIKAAASEPLWHLIPNIQDKILTLNNVDPAAKPDILSRAVGHYLHAFDPTKLTFLEEDLPALRTSFELLARGDGNFAQQVANAVKQILVVRQKENDRIFQEILSQPVTWNPDLKWVVDPKDRTYAKIVDEKAANLRKHLQFTLANHQDLGLSEPDARRYLQKESAAALLNTENLKLAKIAETALNAFAFATDPHSSYFLPESYSEYRAYSSLKPIEGVGVEFVLSGTRFIIKSLVEGSSAKLDGRLKEGDELVSVSEPGGSATRFSELTLLQVKERILGDAGTKVRLQFRRTGLTAPFEVELQRKPIERLEEKASLQIHERQTAQGPVRVAVIKIPRFYAKYKGEGRSVSEDIEKLFEEAAPHGIGGIALIVDGNPGGSAFEGTRMAGMFLGRKPVFGTKNWNSPAKAEFPTGAFVSYSGPLVISVNGRSASGSEFLASALQDYQRAVVVGSRSYGKGSVQGASQMEGLGTIKYTQGLFYRPNGTSVQLKSVIPDISYDDEEARPGEEGFTATRPTGSITPFVDSKSLRKWKSVTPEEIAALSEKSRVRRTTDLWKPSARLPSGEVRLGDWLERGRRRSKESEIRPQRRLEETLSVLTDLIEMRRSKATPANCSGALKLVTPMEPH